MSSENRAKEEAGKEPLPGRAFPYTTKAKYGEREEYVVDAKGYEIASAMNPDAAKEICLALNSQPDLYEACKQLLNLAHWAGIIESEAIDAGKAAISKAEGKV